MNRPIISVVIPVYNVEAYIERCVNSVRNQTVENIEIILIDDGSPDQSPVLCDQYAEKDRRVRVIHKMEDLRLQETGNNSGNWKVYFLWTVMTGWKKTVCSSSMSWRRNIR
ncbi:MAG: glycosyltransferase family 2 protein [Fusicatenibacter saccharivorans]